eukprot:UC1_evm1s1246
MVVAAVSDETPAQKRAAALALVSLRALCSLLQAAPHFNFRINIIETIVPFMKGEQGAEATRVTCDCAEAVFRADKSYSVSLEVVRTMSREIKTCGYKVSPAMVIALRALKIQDYHIRSKQKMEEKMARKRGGGGGGSSGGGSGGHVSKKGRKFSQAAEELE